MPWVTSSVERGWLYGARSGMLGFYPPGEQEIAANVDERLEYLDWNVVLEQCDDDPVLRVELDTTQSAFGTVADGAHHGRARIPLSLFFDLDPEGPVNWVDGEGLEVFVSDVSDDVLEGELRVGLLDYRDAIGEAVSKFFTHALAAREPDALDASIFDLDADGVVTSEEVFGHSYVRGLLIPDLDLFAANDGDLVYWPQHDGVQEALSVSFAFHATRY